jgi:hypothetical protein
MSTLPLLNAFRTLSAQVIGNVTAALPAGDHYLDDEGRPLPGPAGSLPFMLRGLWRTVPAELDGIDGAIVTVGQSILDVASNSELTADARNQRIVAAGDEAWAWIMEHSDAALSTAQQMLDRAQAASYPVRPDTATPAAQEAAMTGLKADWRMILDPVIEGALVDRLGALLERALSDGDALSAWLLTGSHWPADYLTSRGADVWLPAWTAKIRSVLSEADPTRTGPLAVYEKIADPQGGLPVLQTLLGGVVAGIFKDLVQWRPSRAQMTPPTAR